VSYKKPTLQEVVAEVHLGDGVLTPPQFFEIVPALKTAGFGDVEMTGGDVVEVDVEAKSLHRRAQQRVRCWNEDRTKLVQLGQDLLVANLVGEYPGWTAFMAVFNAALESLTTVINPALDVRSLALTTIDMFEVPAEGFRFSDYLNVDGPYLPSWYADEEVPLDITLGKGFIAENGSNRQLRVRVRKRGDEDVMQVHMRAVFHNTVGQGDDDLRELLASFHVESNTMFEGLITDLVRNEVMGGAE